MDLKLFTEFLARLKENRLIAAAKNPDYPTSKIGLPQSEAKGNSIRQIQEIQANQRKMAQLREQLMQMQAQQQEQGNANGPIG